MTVKIVEVEWRDACCEEGPMPLEAIEGMLGLTRYNIGYLVQESRSGVIIASGQIENFHNDKEAYEHVTIIPWGMIIKIETLRSKS